MIKVVVDIRL